MRGTVGLYMNDDGTLWFVDDEVEDEVAGAVADEFDEEADHRVAQARAAGRDEHERETGHESAGGH